MKILQMLYFKPERNSGMIGTAIELGDALTAAGNTVEYLWRDGPESRWGHNFSRFFEIPRAQLRQARAALPQGNYDVVVLHRPHAYLVMQKLEHLYPNCLFLHFSHGWELCVPSFAPDSPTLVQRLKDTLSSALIRWHCNLTTRFAHGHLLLNQLDADFLIKHHGVDPARICILTLGLEPTLLSGPVRAPAPTGTPARFIFIGNYVPQKGCSIMEAALIELAKANMAFTFTCVTHHDQHASLHERLGPILGERLRLLPWQKRELLADLYRAHDFLLFPSRYEGFGKVAHEAMACGLAVVGTNVGVLTIRGVHGENALLCPAGDAAGFLGNLRQAATQPELANRYGPRARAAVADDTWAHTGEQCVDFIKQLRNLGPLVN